MNVTRVGHNSNKAWLKFIAVSKVNKSKFDWTYFMAQTINVFGDNVSFFFVCRLNDLISMCFFPSSKFQVIKISKTGHSWKFHWGEQFEIKMCSQRWFVMIATAFISVKLNRLNNQGKQVYAVSNNYSLTVHDDKSFYIEHCVMRTN